MMIPASHKPLGLLVKIGDRPTPASLHVVGWEPVAGVGYEAVVVLPNGLAVRESRLKEHGNFEVMGIGPLVEAQPQSPLGALALPGVPIPR